MRYSNLFICATVATCVLLSLGCDSNEEASHAFQDVSPVVEPSVITQEEEATKPSPKEDSPETQKVEKPKKQFLLAEFEPPYPNRVNPFAPPSRSSHQAQRSDNSETSVVLLGFAKLDEPKAILNIDGVVSPLANGDQYAGVQVIAIEPPNAVLQRGRDRWTASID